MLQNIYIPNKLC